MAPQRNPAIRSSPNPRIFRLRGGVNKDLPRCSDGSRKPHASGLGHASAKLPRNELESVISTTTWLPLSRRALVRQLREEHRHTSRSSRSSATPAASGYHSDLAGPKIVSGSGPSSSVKYHTQEVMSASTPRPSPPSLPQPKLLPSPPIPEGPSHVPSPRQPLASHAHNVRIPPSITSSPASQHQPVLNASRNGLSRAEAYASAHQPRRSKEALMPAVDKGKQKAGGHVKETSDSGRPMMGSGHLGGGGSKPIFDWISRKLGAGRRASIAEPTPSAGPSTIRLNSTDRNAKYTSLPRKIRTSGVEHPAPLLPPPTANRPGPPSRQPTKAKATVPPARLAAPAPPVANLRPRLSPTNVFPPTPGRDSILSRSESHSLQSYSVLSGSPSERDRRREANNPYPSMPIHMYKGSIMSSSASAWASASGLGERSVSFRTRSRTPSVRSGRSVSSSLRPRINISREALSGGGDSMRSGRTDREGDIITLDDEYDGSGMRTPMGADENASIRPLPPSHPPSPTPSQSMISRSASGSLLSPGPRRSRSLTSARVSRSNPYPSSSSIGDTTSDGYDDGSDQPDLQSRRDSASTKPTTVVSFDSGPGVAHIAQVAMPPPAIDPPAAAGDMIDNAVAAPNVPVTDAPHVMHNSPGSASLISPATPQSPLRTSLSRDNALPIHTPSSSSLPTSANSTPPYAAAVFQAQAPKHSHPHPIHNPRPSSPPNDNASILTLASSTFAAPHPNYSASVHRPSSISRYSMASDYTAGGVPPSATTAVGPSGQRHGLGTSPSVTFAPIRASHEPGSAVSPSQHRPSSLAPSNLSYEQPAEAPRRPPSLASPLDRADKEYPPSLQPTIGTRGSVSLWHGGRGDEGASTRAVRRRGSDNSVGSFESRWSWRGGAGPGQSSSVSPVVGLGRRVSGPLGGAADVSRPASMVK